MMVHSKRLGKLEKLGKLGWGNGLSPPSITVN